MAEPADYESSLFDFIHAVLTTEKPHVVFVLSHWGCLACRETTVRRKLYEASPTERRHLIKHGEQH